MTGARYACCDERRRAALAAPSAPAEISGIDYVEIRPGELVSDPTEIDVVLVKPLPLPAAELTGANIRISGGVRFPAPTVDPFVEAIPGGASVSTYRVTIPGDQPTDFSTYRLAIVSRAGSGAPHASFDPRLSAVDFSFKVDCWSDEDCATDCRTRPEPAPAEPLFDYRTRDWEGFRRLMQDRMAALVSGYTSDDPVDLTTTIIEALAYRADQQSYRLDWVGTESFLDTARSRVSVARHARLVDYRPGAGANARTYVAFSVTPVDPSDDGFILPAGSPLLPRSEGLPTTVSAEAYATFLATEPAPVVFETVDDCPLWRWRSSIALHTWSDEECVLPKGSTAVTVVDGNLGGNGALAVGDLLLLAEVADPGTGAAADADPLRRHVVRLTRVTPTTDVLAPGVRLLDLAWDTRDALPFDLVITATVPAPAGPAQRVICAAAAGNIVLAEHGATLPPPEHLHLPPTTAAGLAPRLHPPAPEPGITWRPRVTGGIGPVARVAPRRNPGGTRPPAVRLTVVDPATCLAAVTLHDPFATWQVRADLLASGPFAREFVVESDDRADYLRFGDGVHGLAPTATASLAVTGRFGSGTRGNLGHGALGHVVVADSGRIQIDSVTNPLPATGGAEPEPIAAARVAAPQAFRVQERAVTAKDYAVAASRFPGVANAVAVPRWTGSWRTMVIYLDRHGGAPVDEAFRAGLLAHLERYRLAGFDVTVRAAKAVPLDVQLTVCAGPEELRGEVGRRVRAVLTPVAPDGTPGFFHPDRFTFGTPLYLGEIVALVMAVSGVLTVTPTVFKRFGGAENQASTGLIRVASTEVLELLDDPSLPERGRLRITMKGGR